LGSPQAGKTSNQTGEKQAQRLETVAATIRVQPRRASISAKDVDLSGRCGFALDDAETDIDHFAAHLLAIATINDQPGRQASDVVTVDMNRC
jgi:hypothetical protein